MIKLQEMSKTPWRTEDSNILENVFESAGLRNFNRFTIHLIEIWDNVKQMH